MGSSNVDISLRLPESVINVSLVVDRKLGVGSSRATDVIRS